MNWIFKEEIARKNEDQQEMIATSDTCQEINLVFPQSVREYIALLREKEPKML